MKGSKRQMQLELPSWGKGECPCVLLTFEGRWHGGRAIAEFAGVDDYLKRGGREEFESKIAETARERVLVSYGVFNRVVWWYTLVDWPDYGWVWSLQYDKMSALNQRIAAREVTLWNRRWPLAMYGHGGLESAETLDPQAADID